MADLTVRGADLVTPVPGDHNVTLNARQLKQMLQLVVKMRGRAKQIAKAAGKGSSPGSADSLNQGAAAIEWLVQALDESHREQPLAKKRIRPSTW